MVGQADVQAVLEQRFWKTGNVLYQGSGAAIAGCNTSCRIHLIGTGNILERIGFYLQRNESHGIPLKQKSGRLPVLVLDQPLCLVVFVNPVKVQRGRVATDMWPEMCLTRMGCSVLALSRSYLVG